MELSGNLKKFPLPKVLQFLTMDQATGMLRLIIGKRQMTLVLEDGNILDVRDTERSISQRMGEILLKSGKMQEQEWNVILDEVKTRLMPVGKVLTDSKFISHDEHRRLIKRVYFEALMEALQLKDGQYEFEHKEDVEISELPDPISVNSLMLNLARQEDEWAELRKIVPSREAVFGRVEDVADETWSKALSSLAPVEQRIAQTLDGFSTIGMVADITFTNDFDAANVISELARRGMVVRIFEQEAAYREAKPQTFFSIKISPLALKVLYASAIVVLTFLIWNKVLLPQVADWENNRVYLETAGLKTDTANAMRLLRLQNAFYAYLKEKGEPPSSLQTLLREGYANDIDLNVIGGGRFVLKVIGLREERALIHGVDANGSIIDGLESELFIR